MMYYDRQDCKDSVEKDIDASRPCTQANDQGLLSRVPRWRPLRPQRPGPQEDSAGHTIAQQLQARQPLPGEI
jgi:hypothetical protein